MDDYFEDEDTDFLLTGSENKKTLKGFTMFFLYLLLALVVIVTAAHGIMVVLHVSEEFTFGSGLFGAFLNLIRISFPITVEMAAVVAGMGFIAAYWRAGQKTVALSIELVWLLFAAANMITMFSIERGLPLEKWQLNWIGYGLPLAALAAGSLTYMLKRTDPDHKRSNEKATAKEKTDMLRFNARLAVSLSPQMRMIEKQKAWVDHIRYLRNAGYSQDQITYMLQGVPELMFDGDADGVPDLLEEGDAPQRRTRRAAPPPSASWWSRFKRWQPGARPDEQQPVVIPGEMDITTEPIGEEEAPRPRYQVQPRTGAAPRTRQNGQVEDFT
ncbi:MAG: hypothetical protein IPM39_23445 [Chloroflexi bacterium]|nr:hypothetical protein [Chloroflexota bacterium]